MRVDIILLVNPWRLGDVLLTECWLQQKQTKSLHTLTRAMSNSADSARAKKKFMQFTKSETRKWKRQEKQQQNCQSLGQLRR